MTDSKKRAFAVREIKDGIVYAYGAGDLTETVPTRGFLKKVGVENPTITLDSGGVVYGFESWWCAEDKKEAFIQGREVVLVDAPTEDDS